MSTKDELTGQESEEIESEQTIAMQHSSVAAETSPANGDYPPCREVEHQEEFETGGSVKEEEEEEEEEGVLEKWEEDFDFDDDDDSDNGLKIYAV